MSGHLEMKVRPLILDDQFRAAVDQVVRFAADHPYIPGETIVPGDDPRYVLQTDFGYRCVFSFTRTPTGFYRDLSVSVDQDGKYPNPFAVYAIADAFGFSGWDRNTIEPVPDGWLLAKDIHFNAIRVCQQIGQLVLYEDHEPNRPRPRP
jgi:hypothetical protein